MESILDLAEQCGVNMHAACKRSGVTYSTYHRIRKGSNPKPETLDKLRAGVLACAHDAGNVPNGMQDEAFRAVNMLTNAKRDPLAIARTIEREARKLVRAVSR